jgi:hypothetical protein
MRKTGTKDGHRIGVHKHRPNGVWGWSCRGNHGRDLRPHAAQFVYSSPGEAADVGRGRLRSQHGWTG